MPVEGAGGESGTATHRLANRAQRRVESGGHLEAAPETQACRGKRGAAWQ